MHRKQRGGKGKINPPEELEAIEKHGGGDTKGWYGGLCGRYTGKDDIFGWSGAESDTGGKFFVGRELTENVSGRGKVADDACGKRKLAHEDVCGGGVWRNWLVMDGRLPGCNAGKLSHA